MTLDDILKLVQVRLGDDLIISQIRKNGKAFALTPDELVRLKTAGASDDVIRAMIDPKAPLPQPAPSPTPAPATVPQALSLPAAYGYYIQDGHKMSELSPIQVLTKFGLTMGNRGYAVDGISDQTPLFRVDDHSPTIIVYQQNVQPSMLQLSTLAFVQSMKAGEFNISNANLQFFSRTFNKDPNETISLDLWRPNRNIQLSVEPIEGKMGMFKLVPTTQLEVGKYALYFTDSIHPNEFVFSASLGRQSTAFAFEVFGGESTIPPAIDLPATDLGRPKLPFGVLSLARADGTTTVINPELALFGVEARSKSHADRVVEMDGPRAPARFTRQDRTIFLVSPPPSSWPYKIYALEVKNDKRMGVLNPKSLIHCSVKAFGSDGKFIQIVPQGDLLPGEYAFIRNDISIPGGVKATVMPFGVDPTPSSH